MASAVARRRTVGGDDDRPANSVKVWLPKPTASRSLPAPPRQAGPSASSPAGLSHHRPKNMGSLSMGARDCAQRPWSFSDRFAGSKALWRARERHATKPLALAPSRRRLPVNDRQYRDAEELSNRSGLSCCDPAIEFHPHDYGRVRRMWARSAGSGLAAPF